jgi:hypothetical protein
VLAEELEPSVFLIRFILCCDFIVAIYLAKLPKFPLESAAHSRTCFFFPDASAQHRASIVRVLGVMQAAQALHVIPPAHGHQQVCNAPWGTACCGCKAGPSAKNKCGCCATSGCVKHWPLVGTMVLLPIAMLLSGGASLPSADFRYFSWDFHSNASDAPKYLSILLLEVIALATRASR